MPAWIDTEARAIRARQSAARCTTKAAAAQAKADAARTEQVRRDWQAIADDYRELVTEYEQTAASWDAESPRPEPAAPIYGCVQHLERGPSCGPDCDELTAAANRR